MRKKYHYVYVTTNLVNKKQYIGDHSTNNLEDEYIGSGLILLSSIKKYGKENFKREIIKICESKEEAFNLQEKYINEYNTLKPNGYNISPKGGHNVSDSFSDETLKKMSENRSGIPSHRKGKTGIYSKETIEKMSESKKGVENPMYGKKIKGRIPWNKGKTGIYSKETIEKMSEAAKLRIGDKNPFYGKTHSEESKEKIKISSSINSKGERNGMFNKKHSEESKEKMRNSKKIKIEKNKDN